MGILDNILTTLRDQPWWAKSKDSAEISDLSTEQLTERLITTEGESSALNHARDLMTRISSLDEDGLMDFFTYLLTMDIDAADLANAATTYQNEPTADHFKKIMKTAEPKWQRVFERINACYNGTVCLVRLRSRLLRLMKQHSEFERLEVTLKSLMLNWFNRGFLVLEPINWSTPAIILEKIIEYEAVHEIASWDDLRARLQPEDRRCFAYFHPAMPDEPLIFVQVALMTEAPEKIDAVLSTPRDVIREEDARVAVFYSISNCQDGLSGISFGNFLIKRVAGDLKRDLPDLDRFVTLSPVSNFREWLTRHDPDFEKSLPYSADTPDADRDEKIIQLAAQYFLNSDRPDGKPNDLVARFHLGNGAELARINLFGDLSTKALERAAGLMVNYEYKLDAVEDRHEDFHKNGVIHADEKIKSLLNKSD
jgi:malonyl-CoA decarboxylase